MGFNDDGQCIPQGDCPDGYARLDDDETGRCYAEHATKICPPNNIRVLQSETCPEVPSEPVTEEPEAEPECEEGFVLKNGACEPLTSNCGVACHATASDKENSTTSDPIPGEPHTPTEDSEDESTDEQETEQDQEPEPEEQEESNDQQAEEEPSES